MITRRGFLARVIATGAVAPAIVRSRAAGAEPPPETSRVRLVKVPALCFAPQFAADELLRAEGFMDVQYLERNVIGMQEALASGEADLSMHYALRLVVRLDAGDPLTLLAGVHTGCIELFGGDRVRSVRDLKGKKVAVGFLGAVQHQLVSLMLTQVGLDPRKDVEWALHPSADAMRLLSEGKVDAFLGVPPEPQELRARKIGRVLLDTGRDRPWSQYFCCMLAANREFHRRHPVATKRTVRAILKAADLCSQDPDGMARRVVDRGFTPSYEYARQTVRELSYQAWREFDPEEAVRFYALRLHEGGFIKSSPKKLIAEGTDWRVLNELKRELKG